MTTWPNRLVARVQTLSADALRDLVEDRGGAPGILRERDFSGETLRGIGLGGWTFEDCVLDDAVLTGADLSGSRWRGGSAKQAKLIDADLVDAHFHAVDLSRARLTGSLLTDTVFDGCRAMGAYLDRTRGLNVRLQGCNFYAANLDGLTCGGKPLLHNRFDESTLRKADLHDCVLDGSSLNGADLAGARLDGADLREATLGECDLERLTHLAGAIISPEQAAAMLAEAVRLVVA